MTNSRRQPPPPPLRDACPQLALISVETCHALSAEFGPPKLYSATASGGVFADPKGQAVIYIRRARKARSDAELASLLRVAAASGHRVRAIILAARSGLASPLACDDTRCLIDVCAEPDVTHLYISDATRLGRGGHGLTGFLDELARTDIQLVIGGRPARPLR